jgi:thiol-disulfide isomerase/thioredoxin
MKKYILLFATLFFTTTMLFSQTTTVELNKMVPNYTFNEILNSKDSQIYLHDLKGKVVILEFWATWCGPCIPAMKKLDELQTKFKEDLKVITVSFDQKKRLENYLKSTNNKLPIAFDTVHHQVFPYKVIPHAILIDKNLIARAITNTENINEDVVKNLIQEKPINLPLKDDFKEVNESDIKIYKSITNANMTLQLTGYNGINTSRVSSFKSKKNKKVIKLEMINQPIDMIYMNLNKLYSSSRVVYDEVIDKNEFSHDNKDNLYCLNIEIADDMDSDVFEIALNFLNEFSEYKTRKINKVMECYTLNKIDDILEPSKAEKPIYMSRGPTLISTKLEMNRVIEYLENLTKIPVIDQTGLTEKYDIELNWQL